MPVGFCSIPSENVKQPCVAFRGQGDAAVRQIASMNDSYGYTIVNCVWPHYSSISQLAGVFCNKLTADAGWRRICIYVGQITIYVICRWWLSLYPQPSYCPQELAPPEPIFLSGCSRRPQIYLYSRYPQHVLATTHRRRAHRPDSIRHSSRQVLCLTNAFWSLQRSLGVSTHDVFYVWPS